MKPRGQYGKVAQGLIAAYRADPKRHYRAIAAARCVSADYARKTFARRGIIAVGMSGPRFKERAKK